MYTRWAGPATRSFAVRFAKLRICCAALGSLLLGGAPAQAADLCPQPIARMASVQGVVEVRRTDAAWQRAELDQPLCAGDAVRVGERSRAALLMSNQTTLRLDQHSHVTLRAPEAPRGTVIEQLRGIVNVITRTPQPFRLTTPFVNANVEGTEFLVQVGAAESTVLVVEGHVVASNQAGRVSLLAGEQATGDAVTLPRKTLVVRPRNAVQWAVHYPTVRPRSGSDPRLQRAARLLDVGRADQALPELQAIAAGDAAYAESLSLQAVVALVQNQPEAARALSQAALAADARSTAALLAASYVYQSRFELDAAAAQAQAAAALEADNALAWARLAELQLYSGRLVDATEAARQAVAQGPLLSRAHLVLGFTRLAHFDTSGARAAFERALQLDQADPLPRMGLGLVFLREGQRTAGREQIDIAVSLDPENALLRSYLGKVYAQERRGAAAETQFRLARERDPLDPTPWFYEALYKLVNNRPVEALDDMSRSIALNDNRAVLRSRLLLDDDRAERSVALARIHDELGFGRLGIAEATKALAIDPDHAAAHRFLADAYTALDRHEAAVASESLQALLLQPVRPAHLLPRRSSTAVMRSVDESLLGTPADDSRFFERSGASGRLGLAAGSRGLWSAEASAAYAGERFALDAGVFRYHTDGFRPGSQVSHRLDDALVQWQLQTGLILQAQLRSRRTQFGDVRSSFSLDGGSTEEDNRIDQHSARLGLVWRPSEREVVTLSYVAQGYDERAVLSTRPRRLVVRNETPAQVLDGQYRLDTSAGDLLLGVSGTRAQPHTWLRAHAPGTPEPTGPCRAEARCLNELSDDARQTEVYAYWQHWLTPDLQGTLGLAHLSRGTDRDRNPRWLPKLGLLWQAHPDVTLRAASFRSASRWALVDQSIEPTSVAGFKQVFDDANGVATRVHAMGLDVALGLRLRLVSEWVQRSLDVPGAVLSAGFSTPPERLHEQQGRIELFWTPHSRIAARAGWTTDRYQRQPSFDLPRLLDLRTDALPLSARYFLEGGWFAESTLTRVRQHVTQPASQASLSGREHFSLVDLSIGRRAASSPLTVTFTVKNLFGERFRFQDDAFRSGDLRVARYLPVRSAVLAVQTAF